MKNKTQTKDTLPLSSKNIYIIIAGIVVLILGNIIVAQEDFIDATKFSVALYVAPIVLAVSVAIIIFGLLYKPKN